MAKKLEHVAVNTRLLLPDGLEGIGRFSVEILKRMVRQHPETQFSFFFDRPFSDKYIFGPNVTPHVLFPPARHPFLFIAFFEFAMARKLRRLRPDVLFSPDGYLSLRSGIPQVPVFHDIAFEHFPEDVKKLEAWHYQRYFPRYAQKARRIITVSKYTAQDVASKYGVSQDNMEVVYNACAEHFHVLPEAEHADIRAKYTDGKPYFHCVGAIQPRKNLARLISAFDAFKKTDTADHQLLVVGRKAWNFEQVIHTYNASPNKSAIRFTGFVSDSELNQIYNASQALVYVPYFEGFGLPILEAMHCDTPLITAKVTSMPEVAGEAAILVDPKSVAEIAAAMRRIVNSPDLATQLVHKGRLQRTHFSWDRSAERVWNVLSNG